MAQTESIALVPLDPVTDKIEVKESLSGKKLKQARLPFMPIEHEQKALKTITPLGSKKRKLSDSESPSAKQAKVSTRPVKPLSPDCDAEVSSSSEAETGLSGSHQKGVKKINTLDRFLYRKRDVPEQEEISSTNDCVPMAIDLTDDSENDNVDSAEKCEKSNAKEKKYSDKVVANTGLCDENCVGEVLKLKAEKETELENCINDRVIEEKKTDSDTGVDLNDEKNKTDNPSEKGTLPVGQGENKENIGQEILSTEEDEVNQSFVSDTSVCEAALKTPAKNNPLVSVLKTPLVTAKTEETPKATALSTSVIESPGTNKDATPKSGKKKQSKSLSESKMKEKEELRTQKEKEREEKRRQKEAEKEEKEKERLEKKRKKDEEKAEKERQRQEEKDKKEKERLEKLQKKEEEKKKKEEQMEAKMEEKRKKDEEKKQKEEEKRLKDEEKQREEDEKLKKKEKVAQSFKSFFIEKTPTVSPPKVKEGKSQFFMPFEMKPNMRLAPALRVENFSGEVKDELDQSLLRQDCETLYLKQLKTGTINKRRSHKTYPRELTEEKDIEIMCHDAETIQKTLHKVKFLKFAENTRPPYYGTWTKQTDKISARKPFKQDEDLFDYEVDSDDEWEEEDPGESVSSDEEDDGKEEKDEDEEDNDGWMVPHGYLSDDEGIDNEEEMDVTKKHQIQAARQEAWEREIKMQTQPLKMISIGCVWEGETTSIAAKQLAKLLSFKAVCLRAGPIAVSSSRNEGDNSVSQSEDDKLATPRPGLKKSVPEEAMPDLIRLLHGNPSGIKKLVKEFRMFWKLKTAPEDSKASLTEEDPLPPDDQIQDLSNNKETSTPVPNDVSMEVDEKTDTPNTPLNETSKNQCENDFAISKRQLELKIPAIAVREKRSDVKVTCWYVKDEVLKQYGMADIQLPNSWEYVHVKAPLWASSNKATSKTDEAAAGKSAPSSGRATPTVGIPNIKQFAQTMSLAQIQAQQAIAVPAVKKSSEENITKGKDEDVKNEDVEVNADIQGDNQPSMPKDQISIKNFFKLATSSPKSIAGKLGNDSVPKADSLEIQGSKGAKSAMISGEKKGSDGNNVVTTQENDVLKVKPIKRSSPVAQEKVGIPPEKLLKVTPLSPTMKAISHSTDSDKTPLKNKPTAVEPMETDIIVLD